MVVSMLSDDMLERQAGVYFHLFTPYLLHKQKNHLFSFEQIRNKSHECRSCSCLG